MEASMHGVGTESVPGAAQVNPDWAARDYSRAWAANGTRPRGERKDALASAARLEHALFALVLGCLGYVWLGALLAEATQAI